MPVLKIQDSKLSVYNWDLVQNQPRTYLSASVASASGTITVDSITDILVSGKDGNGTDLYLLVGNIGDLDAEILTVHATTVPSGSTVTLASNTTKAHTESDPVMIIDFNQVEFSRTTTTGGSKSTLATIAINPNQHYTTYIDITNSTGYGYARFKNVIYGNTYSSYSVEVPYTGYAQNTVGRAILEVYDELALSPDFKQGLVEVNNCLEDIESRKQTWTPKLKLNYILGQTVRWSNAFTLPTDIRGDYDPDSIVEVRLGDTGQSLSYLDYQQFENELGSAKSTTLNGAVSAAATTMTLTNSYDFEESGSVGVVGQDDEITYTANAQSTGVLSGVPTSGTGAVTATLATGAYVWKDADAGQPVWWTINSDLQLLVYPLPSSTYIDRNITIDYYQRTSFVDDLGDTIKTGWNHLVKTRLKWKIRAFSQNNGVASIQDPDFQRYNDLVQTAMKQDKGRKFFAWRSARDMFRVGKNSKIGAPVID